MTALQAAIDRERGAYREVIRWRARYSRCRERMAAMPQRAASRLHYRLKDEEATAIDRHEVAEASLDALRRDYLRRLFQVVT